MSQRKEWFGLINRKSVALILLLCSGMAQAALPSQLQNAKDLDVMLSYVKSNPDVLSSLQAIDLGILTVYYGEGCSAEFARKVAEKSEDSAGPAESLELKKSFCPEETTMVGLDSGDSLGGITSRVTDSCGADMIHAKDETKLEGEGCKIPTE